MKTSGNTILITGGGSGIGEALAHRLHDLGNKIIIAGRQRASLEAASSGRANIEMVELDIGSSNAIRGFARQVIVDHPDLNVLVNNAGIMRNEAIGAARDLRDAEATISTNLLGPIRLIDALIDHLVAQADAAIINITSGLAYVPLISTPTYNATKAALHSYTVALRAILKDRVEVIELVPPAVQTRLTPGQEAREGFMPLDAFADEAIALLTAEPTPAEVLVERVLLQRNAEKEGRFDAAFARLNGL